MIDLTIDISYLSRYYGLSSILPYGNYNVQNQPQVTESGEEPLTIVTEEGQVTVDPVLLQKLLQDPDKLAKIMKLEEPNNRYLIIQQLNEEDLLKLLPYLNSEELSFGLQYFTMEGLNELMVQLPQEQLIDLLLVHFTMEDVVPYMETGEMNRFFESTHLEKRDVMEYLAGMEYGKFQQLMMNQFGAEFENKSADEYLDFINNMEDDEYKRFLQNLQVNEKMEAIAGLCTINPDYYMEFDNNVLARPMTQLLEKQDLIKTMQTLDPEFLAPMVEQLPKDLIQVVATQIDHNDFAEFLSGDFPELLMKMLAG